MIYWSSKDVSLFVAQQVLDDAIAHPEDEAGGCGSGAGSRARTAAATAAVGVPGEAEAKVAAGGAKGALAVFSDR